MCKLSAAVVGLFLGALVLTGCSEGISTSPEESAFAPSYDVVEIGNNETTILYAGQTMEAGFVKVSNTASIITVEYHVNPGWLICETHLAVAASKEGLPQTKSGNPVPGQFPYADEFEPCTEGPVSYEVPNTFSTGQLIYIAAHAVVAGGGSCEEAADIIAGLPTETSACLKGPFDATGLFYNQFYFSEVMLTNSGALDGAYGGWCVDVARRISFPDEEPFQTCFDAWVLPATSGFTFPFLSNPGNLDKVNWILNQDFIGQGYTFGEIQRAIWVLLEGVNPAADAGAVPWTQGNVDAILTAAEAGEGFVPDCGDYIGIVLDPKSGEQPLIIPRLIECECTPGSEETAWGFGERFVPRGNWGTYFRYTIG